MKNAPTTVAFHWEWSAFFLQRYIQHNFYYMFHRSCLPLRLYVSPFSIFLLRTRGDLKFSIKSFHGKNHLTKVKARGVALAQAYYSLSAQEMQSLKEEAAKTKFRPRIETRGPPKCRQGYLSPSAVFFRDNYRQVSKLPNNQRWKMLGLMWRNSRGKSRTKNE